MKVGEKLQFQLEEEIIISPNLNHNVYERAMIMLRKMRNAAVGGGLAPMRGLNSENNYSTCDIFVNILYIVSQSCGITTQLVAC